MFAFPKLVRVYLHSRAGGVPGWYCLQAIGTVRQGGEAFPILSAPRTPTLLGGIVSVKLFNCHCTTFWRQLLFLFLGRYSIRTSASQRTTRAEGKEQGTTHGVLCVTQEAQKN